MKFAHFHVTGSSLHSWYILCLLLAFLPGLPAHAFSGKYPIQNFMPSDYKAGIQNIDFAQNRDMTLFVANNLGILSYNGKSWEKHATRTGKKQRSLAFDEKAGRLYFGSQGEFGYFDGDWNIVSLMDKIPQDAPDFDEVWDTSLRLQEDWNQFEYHFDQIHGDFLNRLRAQFLDLTPNEQKLCAQLRLNLSTKEISNLMNISLRGVEIARYRLRKKLDLDKGQNLSKFVLGY